MVKWISANKIRGKSAIKAEGFGFMRGKEHIQREKSKSVGAKKSKPIKSVLRCILSGLIGPI